MSQSKMREERADVVVDDYILFDCPGQVELFTHHSSLRNIFFRLQKLGYRVLSAYTSIEASSNID